MISEMITARPLAEGREKTLKLADFGPGEIPRSLQLYGIDPVWEPSSYSAWSIGLLDPVSTPFSTVEDVVRGYFEWDDPPAFLSSSDPGFPEE